MLIGFPASLPCISLIFSHHFITLSLWCQCEFRISLWYLACYLLPLTTFVILWFCFSFPYNLHWPMLARTLLSQFGKNPPPSIYDPPPYLIGFLILPHPPGDTWSPGLSSARILLGQFSQNPPLPLIFPLSHFPSTDLHPASLTINPHFSLYF